MTRHRPATFVLIGAVGLLLLAPSSASGQPRGPGGWEDGDDAQAVLLLGRAAAALDRVSYTGTRIVSSWGHGSSTTVLVDVEHAAGQGTLVRMRGGGVAEDTAAFLAAGEGDSPQRPAFDGDSLALLTSTYDLRLGAPGRVAGRSAHVVEIADGSRLVGRIWVDARSGLPLRRELFDSTGRLAIESAFIDLTVDNEAFIAHLPPSTPEAARNRVDPDQQPELAGRGWACPQQVGAMRLVELERMGTASTLHASYSDGLSRVSVFEQPGALDEEALAGFSRARVGGAAVHIRVGMPTYAVWEDSGTVYTVVSDAPVDTIARVVAAYPHTDPPGSGFWDRVGGGMGRLSAWTAPLV